MELWIARYKDGFLGLFKEKPNWRKNIVLGIGIEDWYDGTFLSYLDSNEFPEVTFENSPQKVKLELIKE